MLLVKLSSNTMQHLDWLFLALIKLNNRCKIFTQGISLQLDQFPVSGWPLLHLPWVEEGLISFPFLSTCTLLLLAYKLFQVEWLFAHQSADSHALLRLAHPPWSWPESWRNWKRCHIVMLGIDKELELAPYEALILHYESMKESYSDSNNRYLILDSTFYGTTSVKCTRHQLMDVSGICTGLKSAWLL